MRRPDPTVISVERDLLRELCKTANAAVSPRIETELEQYCWHELDHQIVFEALKRIGRTGGASFPAVLSAEVTRMGFPDIDVSEYFSSLSEQTTQNENESQEIVTKLLARLKSATAPK